MHIGSWVLSCGPSARGLPSAQARLALAARRAWPPPPPCPRRPLRAARSAPRTRSPWTRRDVWSPTVIIINTIKQILFNEVILYCTIAYIYIILYYIIPKAECVSLHSLYAGDRGQFTGRVWNLDPSRKRVSQGIPYILILECLFC